MLRDFFARYALRLVLGLCLSIGLPAGARGQTDQNKTLDALRERRVQVSRELTEAVKGENLDTIDKVMLKVAGLYSDYLDAVYGVSFPQPYKMSLAQLESYRRGQQDFQEFATIVVSTTAAVPWRNGEPELVASLRQMRTGAGNIMIDFDAFIAARSRTPEQRLVDFQDQKMRLLALKQGVAELEKEIARVEKQSDAEKLSQLNSLLTVRNEQEDRCHIVVDYLDNLIRSGNPK